MKYGEIITHIHTLSLKEYKDKYQDVQKFHKMCQRCRHFAKLWTCPPYSFDIDQLLERYTNVELYGYEIRLSEEYASTTGTMEELLAIADDIGNHVRKVTDKELMDLERSREGSRAAFAGNCRICPHGSCSRLGGKPCKYPLDIRYSLENYGFDLMQTAVDFFGKPTQWIKEGRLPNYYFYIGGLLF